MSSRLILEPETIAALEELRCMDQTMDEVIMMLIASWKHPLLSA